MHPGGYRQGNRRDEESPGFHQGASAGEIRRGTAGSLLHRVPSGVGGNFLLSAGLQGERLRVLPQQPLDRLRRGGPGPGERGVRCLQAHLSRLPGGEERDPRNGALRLLPNGDGTGLRRAGPRQEQLAHRHGILDLRVHQPGDFRYSAGL